MDLEIARVTKKMYKAFGGLNEGFADVRLWSKYGACCELHSYCQAKDQIVIDELSTHTDDSRQAVTMNLGYEGVNQSEMSIVSVNQSEMSIT